MTRLLALFLLACPLAALATLADDGEDWALHGQFTAVIQGHPAFAAAFSGANSMDSKSQHNQTSDAGLLSGFSPWTGAAFWAGAEFDQGFGLSNTLGVAGFVSGEAYKVGRHRPYLRLPRAFYQQSFDLGDEQEEVAADQMQLAGHRAKDRLVLTIGKLAVTDIFDGNRYAHDARNDFLNWSIIDAGAFDYAADAWGFTYGGALEWVQGDWSLRSGLFDLSAIPNSPSLEMTPFRQYQLVGELERRIIIGGHDGKLRGLWFDSRGRMGGYDAAIAAAEPSGIIPSVAAVRRFHSKQGLAFNAEQELSEDLGAFVRASVSQGKYEVYEFADINRSLAAGLALSGASWQRTDDSIGVALVMNALSAAGLRYLKAGGLGILVGDGKLPEDGAEHSAELYYRLTLPCSTSLTFDYQYVENPAYNRQRGPISLLAARLHGQF